MRLSKNLLSITLLFLMWQCLSPDKGTENGQTDGSNAPNSEGIEAVSSFSQWLEKPTPLVSAHRGGPYPGFPENALETFQNIVDHTPAVIECDISMTSDSVLVLMHDKTLDRTTNGQGNVNEQSFEALQTLKLIDNEDKPTDFNIPTLEETLAWGKGKALFTLDVKRGVPFEKVIAAIQKYDAASYAAIITYRIQDAKLVYSLDPEVMISVSARDEGAIEQLVQSGIPSKNLLGFVGTREPSAAHYARLQTMGIKTILGTLGNLDRSAAAKGNDEVYLQYVKNGANIIATDRPLEVAQVMQMELIK